MTSLQNTIKQVKAQTKELVSDLWFYMNLTPGSYVALHKVIKRCRYIKTPKDYLECLNDEYPPTPIGEELSWWQRTMKGERIKLFILE